GNIGARAAGGSRGSATVRAEVHPGRMPRGGGAGVPRAPRGGAQDRRGRGAAQRGVVRTLLSGERDGVPVLRTRGEGESHVLARRVRAESLHGELQLPCTVAGGHGGTDLAVVLGAPGSRARRRATGCARGRTRTRQGTVGTPR